MSSELDPVERLLVTRHRGDEITPSSGFVDAVMDAVRQDARVPPPIPFPWVRALPWFVGVVITLVAVMIGAFQAATSTPAASFTAPPAIASMLNAATRPAGIWTTVGVLISLVTTVAALRMGARLERR